MCMQKPEIVTLINHETVILYQDSIDTRLRCRYLYRICIYQIKSNQKTLFYEGDTYDIYVLCALKCIYRTAIKGAGLQSYNHERS